MTWEIDSTHSHLSFAIRVMSVTTTRGRFKTLRGQLHIDEQHPANSWVDAQVEATSIDTRNKLRDAHLRSAAFFGVKKYSIITNPQQTGQLMTNHDHGDAETIA